MYRRELGPSKDALPNELQEIWDAIKRLRFAVNGSILPEGFTWGETTDGRLTVVDRDGINHVLW